MRHPSSQRWQSVGLVLDGLDVEAKPFQRPANERAAGQLVFAAWMALGNAGARVDDRAVGCDRHGQGLGAVQSGAGLRQQLATTAIGDAIRGLNLVP